TVEITTFEVGEGGELRERVVGGGGNCGATFIDDAMTAFLAGPGGLLGLEVYQRFHDDEPVAFLELRSKLEDCKRSFEDGKPSNKYVHLPTALYKLLRQDYPEILHRLKERNRGRDSEIIFTHDAMRGFFQPALDRVERDMRQHLGQLRGHKPAYLFLV